MSLDPGRALQNLRELQKLTSDASGAQRVAWTPVWDRAREWLLSQVQPLGVAHSRDEAGNLWIVLKGRSEKTLLLGGHLDSVPNGGWLDGTLNVIAALEVLRSFAGNGLPEYSIALVDWADEEGARFGRSLFGSSAASGTIEIEPLTKLKDKAGSSLPEIISGYGLSLENLKKSGERLKSAAAYLELHIEQGPVLESLGLSLAAVEGTVGIVRHRITYQGQSAHAGTTPMSHRKDAFSTAARLSLEIREIARRHKGVCTVGSVLCKPGISSAVVGTCEILLEQRHLDADALASMVREAKEASIAFASEEGVTEIWELIWEIPPIPFHETLVSLARDSACEASGQAYAMPSGALHDASEVARAGIPTAMLFVQSLRGLSHTKEEDTKDEHIKQSLVAFHLLAQKTLSWLSNNESR